MNRSVKALALGLVVVGSGLHANEIQLLNWDVCLQQEGCREKFLALALEYNLGLAKKAVALEVAESEEPKLGEETSTGEATALEGVKSTEEGAQVSLNNEGAVQPAAEERAECQLNSSL